eukprot:gene19386-biopygen14560
MAQGPRFQQGEMRVGADRARLDTGRTMDLKETDAGRTRTGRGQRRSSQGEAWGRASGADGLSRGGGGGASAFFWGSRNSEPLHFRGGPPWRVKVHPALPPPKRILHQMLLALVDPCQRLDVLLVREGCAQSCFRREKWCRALP